VSDDELFNKAQADYNRDQAIALVDRNAPEHWKPLARAAIELVARRQLHFTVDDIWPAMPEDARDPPNKKTMGSEIRKAATAGIMVADGFARTTNVNSNGHPTTRWKSLIYGT
jgi:hypothetical protein